MIVTESRFLRDCFDGTIEREVCFDELIDEAFIYYLQNFGSLQYFPDFPRPFFIFEEYGCYTIKGALGNSSARITLGREREEASLSCFVDRCIEYDRNTP